jgi:hypothetical protein
MISCVICHISQRCDSIKYAQLRQSSLSVPLKFYRNKLPGVRVKHTKTKLGFGSTYNRIICRTKDIYIHSLLNKYE